MGPLCDMTKNIGFKMGFNWEHINHTMVLSEDGTLSENHLSQSHYLVVIIQTVSAFCIVFGFG